MNSNKLVNALLFIVFLGLPALLFVVLVGHGGLGIYAPRKGQVDEGIEKGVSKLDDRDEVSFTISPEMCLDNQKSTSIKKLRDLYALDFTTEACSIQKTDNRDGELSKKAQERGARKTRRVGKEVTLCLN